MSLIENNPLTVRECGGCTLCCKVMSIPEIGKNAGAWCPDCDPGEGCKLHDGDKPDVCRQYVCEWLDGAFGLKERPDLLGVVFGSLPDGALLPDGQMVPVVAAYERHDGHAMSNPHARAVIREIRQRGQPVVIFGTIRVTEVRLTINNEGIAPWVDIVAGQSREIRRADGSVVEAEINITTETADEYVERHNRKLNPCSASIKR